MPRKQFSLEKTYFKPGDPRFGRTTSIIFKGKSVQELMGVVTKGSSLKQLGDIRPDLMPLIKKEPAYKKHMKWRKAEGIH